MAAETTEAREEQGKGRKAETDGTEVNLLTHLHADSQVLRLHHVRVVPLGAAILETGRSLGGSRGRKKSTEQSQPPAERAGMRRVAGVGV